MTLDNEIGTPNCDSTRFNTIPLHDIVNIALPVIGSIRICAVNVEALHVTDVSISIVPNGGSVNVIFVNGSELT